MATEYNPVTAQQKVALGGETNDVDTSSDVEALDNYESREDVETLEEIRLREHPRDFAEAEKAKVEVKEFTEENKPTVRPASKK